MVRRIFSNERVSKLRGTMSAMKVVVVANWKMNPPTLREAKALFEAERKSAEKAKKAHVIIAPPAIFLRDLIKAYRGSKVAFAIQHAHYESGGAHTGELSLAQAKDARVKYAIIGHAERRTLGESDDDTRKKVAAALSLSITPIFCVGERERRDDGEHFELIREQMHAGLADVAASSLSRILIVYEPLWTIGKEKAMEASQMHEMAIFIRKCVVESHGEAGRSIKILYGGSVDEKNAGVMLREGDVIGFLVGRASLDPKKFPALLSVIND